MKASRFRLPFAGTLFGKNYSTDSAGVPDIRRGYMKLLETLFPREATVFW